MFAWQSAFQEKRRQVSSFRGCWLSTNHRRLLKWPRHS